MIDLLNLKPGVNYLNMSHDYGCPSIDSQSALDCTCSPEFALVSEEQWLKDVNQTRKQRRKAARAAQKAMKKMRGDK
jgi:hypothetical protein